MPQNCVVCGCKRYEGEFWSEPDGSCSRFLCSVYLFDIACGDGLTYGGEKRAQESSRAEKGSQDKQGSRTAGGCGGCYGK